jgi:hypothetical protein
VNCVHVFFSEMIIDFDYVVLMAHYMFWINEWINAEENVTIKLKKSYLTLRNLEINILKLIYVYDILEKGLKWKVHDNVLSMNCKENGQKITQTPLKPCNWILVYYNLETHNTDNIDQTSLPPTNLLNQIMKGDLHFIPWHYCYSSPVRSKKLLYMLFNEVSEWKA